MVNFMKNYYINKMCELCFRLYGIYDPASYFYVIECLENYGFEHDDILNMIYRTSMADINGYRISAFTFLVYRYNYCYWNIMIVAVLKLFNLGVLGMDIPKLSGSVLYDIDMPDADNFYQVPSLSDDCDNVISNYFSIVSAVLKLAGWQISEIELENEKWLLEDIAPYYQKIVAQIWQENYDEISDYILEKEDSTVNFILLSSDRIYSHSAGMAIFEWFVPDGFVLSANCVNSTIVIILYGSLYSERGLDVEIGRQNYNILSVLIAYSYRINYPCLMLPGDEIW